MGSPPVRFFVKDFVKMVHRGITLNGSSGFPLKKMNKNTDAKNPNRQMFFLWQIYVNKTFSLPFYQEQLSAMQEN